MLPLPLWNRLSPGHLVTCLEADIHMLLPEATRIVHAVWQGHVCKEEIKVLVPELPSGIPVGTRDGKSQEKP